MESGPANGRSPESNVAQRGTNRFMSFGVDCATFGICPCAMPLRGERLLAVGGRPLVVPPLVVVMPCHVVPLLG